MARVRRAQGCDAGLARLKSPLVASELREAHALLAEREARLSQLHNEAAKLRSGAEQAPELEKRLKKTLAQADGLRRDAARALDLEARLRRALEQAERHGREAARAVELEQELTKVFQQTLRTAGFIGGPMVENFEKAFAEFCDTKHAVAVSSGTDALRFAIMGAGVQPGDVVVTVPHDQSR